MVVLPSVKFFEVKEGALLSTLQDVQRLTAICQSGRRMDDDRQPRAAALRVVAGGLPDPNRNARLCGAGAAGRPLGEDVAVVSVTEAAFNQNRKPPNL